LPSTQSLHRQQTSAITRKLTSLLNAKPSRLVHTRTHRTEVIRSPAVTLAQWHTVLVIEDTMFVEDVRSTQLNVLRHSCVVRSTETRLSVFDVVDEAFRHQRIFIQIHQVRRLQQPPYTVTRKNAADYFQ